MNPLKNVTSPTVIPAHRGVPRVGQLIGDRYRLDRPLERGAMGSVWRAEQVRLRAPVAVKFLDPSLIGDKEMHDRFIQEARSAAAVRSAHVVQVFDYGSEDGVPYIAMELLDGENLDSRLGARGTLTPAELSKLFSELARGISQAHAIGVIHRDLKPGNIFLAREGEHEVTKIVDFGIAKVKASALRLTQGIGTQLGTLLGTPQYMSPEQVRGAGSIDHRTDLWALAVIACECLTGRCPFSGATIGDLTVQICTEKPPAPSSLGNVPAGFDQWFFKATQKKPNKRFQSVEEMAERLQAVLGPAMLAAPGGVRAGRLITFPSRSEVRLAYSAVVTWKGYVMSRLGDTWMDLRRLMLRVGHYLAIRYEVAQQRFDELLESERLAFLRPVIERHGMFASVALLCCGILLLGLTTRGGEPSAVTAGPADAPTPVVPAPAALGGIAPVSGHTDPGAPTDTQAPSVAAAPPATTVASPSTLASAAPAVQAEDVQAPRRALDDFVVPKPAVASAGADDAPAIATSALALQPHARVARNDAEPRERASTSPAAQKPSRSETPAPIKKTKPITKAMAQAATKILNADDLVASVPAKKAPPRATPRPARRPSNTPVKGGSSPFDDRL